MTFNSLVFPLTVSTTIASAFVISEGRSNFQWNWPMTSQRKIIVPIDTADSSPKVSFEFAKRIIIKQRNSWTLTKGNVQRNKMLWRQKRTQLPNLKLDLATENKTPPKRHIPHSIMKLSIKNVNYKKPQCTVLSVSK